MASYEGQIFAVAHTEWTGDAWSFTQSISTLSITDSDTRKTFRFAPFFKNSVLAKEFADEQNREYGGSCDVRRIDYPYGLVKVLNKLIERQFEFVSLDWTGKDDGPPKYMRIEEFRDEVLADA